MRKRHVRDDSTEGIAPQDQGDLDLDGLDLGDQGEPAGRAIARTAGPLPYLELKTKDCDRSNPVSLELHSCKCKSWFCMRCCGRKGQAIKERLLPILTTYSGLQMWTLTIDPQLFTAPVQAFQYVRKQRCVARFVRTLRARELLHSPRFFCVVEWQKDTEMPHYHILLDTHFIPFDLACDIWNTFRPSAAGPIVGDRPGFGAIRFSHKKNRFQSPEHAAHYACKYLTKHPVHGYPAWVMKVHGQIHRYCVSHRFWRSAGSEGIPIRETGGHSIKPRKKRTARVKTHRTIEDRVSDCCATSVLLSYQAPAVAGEKPKFGYLESIPESVNQLAGKLGRTLEGGVLRVSLKEVVTLREDQRRRREAA